MKLESSAWAELHQARLWYRKILSREIVVIFHGDIARYQSLALASIGLPRRELSNYYARRDDLTELSPTSL